MKKQTSKGHALRPKEATVSRSMAYLLRHRPQSAGLVMDDQGWVELPAMLDALRKARRREDITAEDLAQIVAHDPKGRYEIDADANPPRIRASYGHSVKVRIQYEESEPPEFLYHGTVIRSEPEIRAHGVLRMERKYVHLSETAEMAREVGSRRGEPVVLVVEASRMAAAGYRFYRMAAGIYLTETVPPEFLLPSPVPAQERAPDP